MSATSRGILYPARLPRFTRVPAPDAVADLVGWFWIPEWDVGPGRTSRQHVVAFPACNLVVESGRSAPAPPGLVAEGGFVGFAGPTTRRSHQDLTGRGWAVGAHLRPAAVVAFTDDPGSVRDAYVRLDHPDLLALVTDRMTTGDRDGRPVRAAEAFAEWLAERVPPPGPEADLANAMAALIGSDPGVLRLEDVAARLGTSQRTLQRLARRYVGLPPAAMIRRRRLQEAAERVRTEPGSDLAAIAADLGYADQAHLANDFRAVLGMAPSHYRAAHGNLPPAQA